MCSCLPFLKLPCLKISGLKITGWPWHLRRFGCVPGIELLAGSSFFPAKVKCSQKKEMIDYPVWKKDWHTSSSPVDLILPSRDCAASRELSQGRGEGLGELAGCHGGVAAAEKSSPGTRGGSRQWAVNQDHAAE